MKSLSDLLIEANNYFYEAKYNEALSLYYKILAEDLNNSFNYYNIGLTYEMLSEYELAVSFYKKAVRIDNNIRSVNNLARIYIDTIKNFDIAKEYLNFAVKTAPKDAEAYNSYGNLSFIEKDYELAISYYKKSIFLDEKFFKNYFDIANAYYQIKDKEKAIAMIDKCIELKDNFEPAKDLAKKIYAM